MIYSSTNSGLVKADIIDLSECFTPVKREYDRGEIITICSSENDTIGIILSGTAYLSTTNTEEQRRILDYYGAGEMFGMHFIPQNENKGFYIVAKTACTVYLVKYEKFISCCHNHCEKHTKVISNLIMSGVKKHLAHIDVLSQRTLRSKLLSFFEYLKNERGSNSFILPLPLSDLADYLAVDRSAMMREIKKLNEEEVIKSARRKITLLF